MPTVLVPLAEGFEEVEAITIVDLLRRAGIRVVTAALGAQPVKGSHGVGVLADTTLEEAVKGEYDMVVLPGGLPGSDNLDRDLRVRELLKRTFDGGRYVAAICAAPKVLAGMGLLAGRQATSYPGVLEQMRVPGLTCSGEAVVCDGKVITARSPGTAMDFALTLIERLVGAEKRAEVERALVRA